MRVTCGTVYPCMKMGKRINLFQLRTTPQAPLLFVQADTVKAKS